MRAMLAIARNTLYETMRQSVYGLILAAAAFLIALSTQIAMFTFMSSTKLVQDMGLATILLSGLFLGVLAASTVVHREIEGRTALTVLSKPVRREAFLLGKYLGIAAAVTVATYILTILLMLAVRFGVKDTASTKLDWGVAAGVGVCILVALLVGFLHNYFFGRPFMTAAVWSLAAALTLAVLVFSFVDKEGKGTAFGAEINWQVGIAGVLTLEAVLILVAAAVATATRGRAAVCLAVAAVLFVGGLVSEFAFGRFADSSIWARLGYTVFPNLQVFWVTEGLFQFKDTDKLFETPGIPADYVGMATVYALAYIGAALTAGLVLFERREVRE
ncbi:MAG: hypothetical protein ACOCX4_10300 [Planctomycetota bacterium]